MFSKYRKMMVTLGLLLIVTAHLAPEARAGETARALASAAAAAHGFIADKETTQPYYDRIERQYLWSVRLLEAELSAREQMADRREALKQHAKRVALIHSRTEKMADAGLVERGFLKVTAYYTVQAEDWMPRAVLSPGR